MPWDYLKDLRFRVLENGNARIRFIGRVGVEEDELGRCVGRGQGEWVQKKTFKMRWGWPRSSFLSGLSISGYADSGFPTAIGSVKGLCHRKSQERIYVLIRCYNLMGGYIRFTASISRLLLMRRSARFSAIRPSTLPQHRTFKSHQSFMDVSPTYCARN